MIKYEYICKNCKHPHPFFSSLSELYTKIPKECEICWCTTLNPVFSKSQPVFRGSGFATNDLK